jgi:hypothetical protein
MAVEAGAHALGFVFAPSLRQIDPETARGIISRLPPMVTRVGVFVDAAPARVKEVMAECHLDLVQRYGVHHLKEFEFSRWYGQLRRILEGLIKREMALEINSSGLRQSPQSPYPSRAILKLFRELGGQLITLGSDAHQPVHLADGLEQCLELARNLGGFQVVSFQNRLPVAIT